MWKSFSFKLIFGLGLIGIISANSDTLFAEFYGNPKTGLQQIKSDRYGATCYVPENYTADKDWPLVVVMYSDEAEKGVKFNEKWLAELKKRNLIVLFVSYLAPREMPFASDERLLKLIRQTADMYRIDHKRVLLTAFGEAAHYAFYLGFYYPEYFSAVALVGGGAEGRYESFFSYGNSDAKSLPFLILYGDHDQTIQKQSFIPVHEKLHARGYLVELQELEGLGHKLEPQFETKIMDWFGGLPVKEKTLKPEDEIEESSAAKGIASGLDVPKFVSNLVRGIFKG